MKKEPIKPSPIYWKEVQEIESSKKESNWFMKFLGNFENHEYPNFEKFVNSIFKSLLYIPFLRKLFEESAGGTFGIIFRNLRVENYQKVYEVALNKIKQENFKKGKGMLDHPIWWMMMEYACQSAENLDSTEKKKELIQLMLDGPEPLQGYHVSLSFCNASRWYFGMNEAIQALDLARRARDADPTYEQAWFLLGWLSKVLDRDDAESFILKAVELQPQIWTTIIQDPLCSSDKEMLRSLKEKALARGIAVKVDPSKPLS